VDMSISPENLSNRGKPCPERHAKRRVTWSLLCEYPRDVWAGHHLVRLAQPIRS
jgi:hypothetical protein